MNLRRLQNGSDACFRAQGSENKATTKVIQIQGIPARQFENPEKPRKTQWVFLNPHGFFGLHTHTHTHTHTQNENQNETHTQKENQNHIHIQNDRMRIRMRIIRRPETRKSTHSFGRTGRCEHRLAVKHRRITLTLLKSYHTDRRHAQNKSTRKVLRNQGIDRRSERKQRNHDRLQAMLPCAGMQLVGESPHTPQTTTRRRRRAQAQSRHCATG